MPGYLRFLAMVTLLLGTTGASADTRVLNLVLAKDKANQTVTLYKEIGDDSGGSMERRCEVVFDGFDSRDLRDIEEYLVIFSGYHSYRPKVTRKGLLLYLLYTPPISTAKLQRNLINLVDVLGLDATMRFSGNPCTMRIKKARRKWRSGDEKKNLYQW